jgi:dATP pyrophosphohydrolase
MNVLTGSISTYVFSFGLDAQPRFLLLLRAAGLLHAGTWQAVHGMIDDGERAYAAALRETLEETGLRPERFFKTDYVETFYSEHTDAVHLVPAFAAFVSNTPPPALSEEHTDFAWLTHDDALARFVWPSQKEAVRIIAGALDAWPLPGRNLQELRNSSSS